MIQTKLRSEPACQGKEDGNISIPIGLSKVFEDYFEIIGMNDLLNGFKLKGAALAPLVRCMCVHSLDDHDNSLQSCADWTSNPHIGELLDLDGPQSQRTFNRALQILGENRVKIIERLFDGIRRNFDADDISVAVDGSAVRRESDYGDMAGTGHPRDKNPDGMQTEFMMAVYQKSKIPFYVGAFSGEVSDEEQYARSLPEILSLLDHGKLDAYAEYLEEWKPPDSRRKNEQIHPFREDADLSKLKECTRLARWIVLDNGGASKYNTDLICGLGHNYITRKKLNGSDRTKTEDRRDWEYVEPGVWCTKTVFGDSGRTSYLFFNEALYAKKLATAERRFSRRMEITEKIIGGKVPKNEMVSKKDIPFVDFDVTVTVQNVLGSFTEDDRKTEIERMMGPFAGIFKLESNRELTPKDALELYRGRVIVEHTISSFKQISGIKPIRVWRRESVIGSLVLALLTEAVLSMARFDAEPRPVPRTIGGVRTEVRMKPSTKTIRGSLSHLTVTVVNRKNSVKELVYSNWEPLSKEIFEAIERHFTFKRCQKVPVR